MGKRLDVAPSPLPRPCCEGGDAQVRVPWPRALEQNKREGSRTHLGGPGLGPPEMLASRLPPPPSLQCDNGPCFPAVIESQGQRQHESPHGGLCTGEEDATGTQVPAR